MDATTAIPKVTVEVSQLYIDAWRAGQRNLRVVIGDDPEQRWVISSMPDEEPKTMIWSWRPENGGLEIGRQRFEWEAEIGGMTAYEALEWLIERAGEVPA